MRNFKIYKNLINIRNGNLITLLLVISFSIVTLTKATLANDVTLSLDREEIGLDEQTTLELSISGNNDINSEPEISNTQNFDIDSAGSSSQISIINGVSSIKKNFNYVLTPRKAGTFTIGPAKVNINGKVIITNQVKLTVSANGNTGSGSGSAASRVNQNQDQDQDQDQNADSKNQYKNDQKNIFIEESVNNKNPYINQEIVYTFKLFARVQATNVGLALPDFKGFRKEDITDPNRPKQYETTINGSRYIVSEFKIALFPNSVGAITIPPATITADVIVQDPRVNRRSSMGSFFDQGFFGSGLARMKKIKIQSNDIKLNIKALPEHNKPANFSGLIGDFRIEGNISKSTLKVGESSTLTIKISGNGNIKEANLDNLAIDGFKSYDDKPSIEIRPGIEISGTKTFKKALVPTRQGTITIPPIAISYFNPRTASYNNIQTTPIEVNVLPGDPTDNQDKYLSSNNLQAKNPNNLDNKKEIKIIGQDLMPIIRGKELEKNEQLSLNEKIFLFSSIFILPLIYIFAFFRKKRLDLIEGDTGLLLRENAYKNFKIEVAKINVSGPNNVFFNQASNLLREYLSNKLGLQSKGITYMDVERILTPFIVPDKFMMDTKKFLELCESLQYGGTSDAYNTNKKKELKLHLEDIVKNLEKVINKQK
ncbi:MAG: protein BatD [Oligoflexia bacterium]|nr:protein BatD [Oligoflexia bacterium]